MYRLATAYFHMSTSAYVRVCVYDNPSKIGI